MRKRTIAATALGALLLAGTIPTRSAPLPKRVGECTETKVKAIESRLEGAPDSGSAVSYVNGGYQVSYDIIPEIQHSRRGDPIRLCLVSLPKDCPPGDTRGRVYRATNLRTHESWQAADAEHMCGGA